MQWVLPWVILGAILNFAQASPQPVVGSCAPTRVNGEIQYRCADFGLIAVPSALPTNTVAMFLGSNLISQISSSGGFTSSRPCHDCDEARTIETPLTELQTLDLSDNRLTMIEMHYFAGLLSLEVLQLNDNLLTNVAHAAFSTLTSLHTLHLNGNSLVFMQGDGRTTGLFTSNVIHAINCSSTIECSLSGLICPFFFNDTQTGASLCLPSPQTTQSPSLSVNLPPTNAPTIVSNGHSFSVEPGLCVFTGGEVLFDVNTTNPVNASETDCLFWCSGNVTCRAAQISTSSFASGRPGRTGCLLILTRVIGSTEGGRGTSCAVKVPLAGPFSPTQAPTITPTTETPAPLPQGGTERCTTTPSNVSASLTVVSCAGLNLTRIPVLQSSARVLILSQNNISAIQSPYGLVSFSECNSCDSGFKTTPLQNLVSLDLESNEITRITSTDFEGLTALDSLNLNANFITQVSRTAFRSLTRLTSLRFDQNPLILAGLSLGNITNVRGISCSALPCEPGEVEVCSTFSETSTDWMCEGTRSTNTPTAVPTLAPTNQLGFAVSSGSCVTAEELQTRIADLRGPFPVVVSVCLAWCHGNSTCTAAQVDSISFSRPSCILLHGVIVLPAQTTSNAREIQCYVKTTRSTFGTIAPTLSPTFAQTRAPSASEGLGFASVCRSSFLNVSSFVNLLAIDCVGSARRLSGVPIGLRQDTQAMLLQDNAIRSIRSPYGFVSVSPCAECDEMIRRQGLRQLLYLNLGRNLLTSVVVGDLKGLRSLRTLILANNAITLVSYSAFGDLTQMTELSIGQNPLRFRSVSVSGTFFNQPHLFVEGISCSSTQSCSTGTSRTCPVFVNSSVDNAWFCVTTLTSSPTQSPTRVPTVLGGQGYREQSGACTSESSHRAGPFAIPRVSCLSNCTRNSSCTGAQVLILPTNDNVSRPSCFLFNGLVSADTTRAVASSVCYVKTQTVSVAPPQAETPTSNNDDVSVMVIVIVSTVIVVIVGIALLIFRRRRKRAESNRSVTHRNAAFSRGQDAVLNTTIFRDGMDSMRGITVSNIPSQTTPALIARPTVRYDEMDTAEINQPAARYQCPADPDADYAVPTDDHHRDRSANERAPNLEYAQVLGSPKTSGLTLQVDNTPSASSDRVESFAYAEPMPRYSGAVGVDGTQQNSGVHVLDGRTHMNEREGVQVSSNSKPEYSSSQDYHCFRSHTSVNGNYVHEMPAAEKSGRTDFSTLTVVASDGSHSLLAAANEMADAVTHSGTSASVVVLDSEKYVRPQEVETGLAPYATPSELSEDKQPLYANSIDDTSGV
eukprot:m.198994 g.198994  ORF g.198994 m.198994 type:complete len:1299 (-) comp15307_c0_seq8:119-4015(-)